MNLAAMKEGQEKRRRIAAIIIPQLKIGGRVPSCTEIAPMLGISKVAAHKHIRRMLREKRIEVELLGRGALIVVGRMSA